MIFLINTVTKNISKRSKYKITLTMIDYISFSYLQGVSDLSHFLLFLSFSTKLKPKILE